MKTGKNLIRVIMILVLAVAVAVLLYFYVPRSVVAHPETATIDSILIQRAPHYQKEESDCFIWRPESEEDQALAQEIVTYLSQRQEHRTLRTTPGYVPPDWKCMYILVDTSAPQSTLPHERAILLAPSQTDGTDHPEQYDKAVNISYDSMCTDIFGKFRGVQGDLIDPDSIRTFVLDALDLPEDFM